MTFKGFFVTTTYDWQPVNVIGMSWTEADGGNVSIIVWQGKLLHSLKCYDTCMVKTKSLAVYYLPPVGHVHLNVA